MRVTRGTLTMAAAILAFRLPLASAQEREAADPAPLAVPAEVTAGEGAVGPPAPFVAASASPPAGIPAAEPALADVPTMIYSVNRTPEIPFDVPRAVNVISREEIRRRNARSVPELLMEEAGVFVQHTNYGGGSPIIRGLIGKQILILIDGVRMNTATYRFGPVQYLNTIDLNMVERIEIVRGVVSVLGSDSAGGAINIVTRRGPGPGEQGIGGQGFTRFSSADQAFDGHVEASGRGEEYRFFAGASYQSTGDLTGGGDVGTQGATGYDQAAGNLSFDYFVGASSTLSVGYQFLEQKDVPRTDRVLAGDNLVFDFDPQRRHLFTASFEDHESGFHATGYWNRQEEGRQEIRTSAPDVERALFDRQDAFGLNLDKGTFLGPHYLLFGLDYSWETIASTRTDTNLRTGAERTRRGNWTDGASYQTFAVYLRDRVDVGDFVSLTLGGRYGRFSSAGIESSSLGDFDLSGTQDALTGTANLVIHVTPQLNLIGGVTRGFRAANLDDISVFDERAEGTEIPNPDVEPERIWSYEAGAKFESDSFGASAFYYQSDLSELLLRSPGMYRRLPFLDLNGDGVQEPGEPNVLERLNIGESRIHGFETEARWRVASDLDLFGHLTYTEGDDLGANEPLPRIPPTYGAAGLRWTSRSDRSPWAEAVWLFAGEQTRLSSSDISDPRIGPDGTPAFNVINLRGGLSFGSLQLSLAIENLFDEKYKYHASGMYRPGLQVVFGAGYGF